MFTRLGFRCQRCARRSRKGNTAPDKLVKGTGFHHAAYQAEIKRIAGGQPENGVIAHQMLVTFADTQANHNAIGERPQRQASNRTHFDAAEQDRCTDAQ